MKIPIYHLILYIVEMRKYLLILAMAFVTSAYSQILENKMSAKFNEAKAESHATNGSIAIMETSTGKLFASSGNIDEVRPTKILTPFVLLACLESGGLKLTDEIDTGEGAYINGTDTIKDHNHRLGGYGVISVLDGFTHCSDITTQKAIDKAFGQSEDYRKQLEAMDISSIDYLHCNASLLQILTLYNAIANNNIKGKAENVEAIKQALKSNMTDGLGRQFVSDKTEVAAYGRTTILENGTYKTDVCGYTPRYTIIVSMEQATRPLPPNNCYRLFRGIVELMAE